MSESGIQVGIARVRSAAVCGHIPDDGAAATPDEAAVRGALAEVMDPELPVVSIVDLGMVRRVTVDPAGIDVAILPTFVGCPALDVIRDAVADRLKTFGLPVRVESTFEVPWTTALITPAGLAALAAAGIAPPGSTDRIRCPLCASDAVVQDSLFGPTQCRSLYYCRSCRQPFEALKTV